MIETLKQLGDEDPWLYVWFGLVVFIGLTFILLGIAFAFAWKARFFTFVVTFGWLSWVMNKLSFGRFWKRPGGRSRR